MLSEAENAWSVVDRDGLLKKTSSVISSVSIFEQATTCNVASFRAADGQVHGSTSSEICWKLLENDDQ